MTNIFSIKDRIEKTYDNTMFLGRLCWYAVPESTHPDRSQFINLLNDNGLNVTPPNNIRPVDVFKRACQVAKVTRHKFDGDPHVYNYLVRSSGADAEHVWRTIVRETFDAQDRRLGYDEIFQVEYNREAEDITVKWKENPTDYEILLWRAIKDYYNSSNNTMTPISLRDFIRRTLERDLQAVCVRPSGGVYFVRSEHADTLSGLEKVIKAIGADFHTFPLLDDSKQREMLRKAFEDESVGDIDRLMGEIADIMRDGKKITKSRFLEYKSTADDLREKIKDYSDLLDTALSESATRLEILSKQLLKLMKQNVKQDAEA